MFKRILAIALVFVGICLYLGVCSVANDTKAEIESDAYNKYIADAYSQDVYYNMPDFDNYDEYVDYVNNLEIEYEPFVSDLDVDYLDDSISGFFDDSKAQVEEFYLPEFEESDEPIYLSTLYKPTLSDDDYKLFYSLNLTPADYVTRMGWEAFGGHSSDMFSDSSHPRGDFIAAFDEAFLVDEVIEQGYKYMHLASKAEYLFIPRFLVVDGKEHLIFNLYVKKDNNRYKHEIACAGSDITHWYYFPLDDWGVELTTNENKVITTTTPGSDEPPVEWVELRYADSPFYMFPIAWNAKFCNVGLPVYDSQGNIETYYIGGSNNTVYCFYISYTKPDQQARLDFEKIGYDYRHYMIAHATSDSSKIATQNEDSVMHLRYTASHLLSSPGVDLTDYLPQFYKVFSSGFIFYGMSLLDNIPQLEGIVAPLSFLLRGVGIIVGSADGVIDGFGYNFFVSVAVISIFISLLGVCLGFYSMFSSQSVSVVRSYMGEKSAEREKELFKEYKEIKKGGAYKKLTFDDYKEVRTSRAHKKMAFDDFKVVYKSMVSDDSKKSKGGG